VDGECKIKMQRKRNPLTSAPNSRSCQNKILKIPSLHSHTMALIDCLEGLTSTWFEDDKGHPAISNNGIGSYAFIRLRDMDARV
jgi:hypothetical protein